MSALLCHTRSLSLCGPLFLLNVAGCGSPHPADQFKPIADAKKTALTAFLESKHSKLLKYTATVTEETSVEKRGDHTHVGLIEFEYGASESENKGLTVAPVTAEYHFSAKEKKWVYRGCLLKQEPWLHPKDKLLVTFPEVKTTFEH